MESEPHNPKNFVHIADGKADKQVSVNEQGRQKLKDQGDELVEMNLADTDKEPRSVFLSAQT